jgi:hypothetical protein
MSNTVQERLNQVADYTPGNLQLDGRNLHGYSLAQVLPYAP